VSFGVGVERTFPVHSPTIAKIEVVTLGDVRRAKLYYLRERHGKAAKIKERRVARGSGKAGAGAGAGAGGADVDEDEFEDDEFEVDEIDGDAVGDGVEALDDLTLEDVAEAEDGDGDGDGLDAEGGDTAAGEARDE
jgi:hypothetical protein